MGLAEMHALHPDSVTDGPVVSRELGPGFHVDGRHIVPERNSEGACVRRVRMVEVATIVSTKHPETQVRVERRVSPEKALQAFRSFEKLFVREHPVDTAVKAPDYVACTHRLGQEHADAMNAARPKLRVDHHHRYAPHSSN
jgi:hypothetical protein